MANKEPSPENRFSGERQPKTRRFRGPAKIKGFCKEFDLEIADYRRLMKNLLFGKTFDELKKFAAEEGDKYPAVVALIANTLIKESQRGKAVMLNGILDRLFGKVKQEISVESPYNAEELHKFDEILFKEGADGTRALSQDTVG
jgi:hypothetical protein